MNRGSSSNFRQSDGRPNLGGSYAERKAILTLAVVAVLPFVPVSSLAQETPAPSFTPGQLDELVARIALYPDSLLAQVLAGRDVSRPHCECISNVRRNPSRRSSHSDVRWLVSSQFSNE
jgi:hypothetical protein